MPAIFAPMATLNYIIWNGSPEIFSIGTFALRWYGLFFALGFLISQQVLYYMYRKEGKPEKDVDTLTIYMVIATIIGARLGHIIFYQPEILWQNPLGVFLPFEFNPFRFTGLQGLASHGGAIGILFAIWLYTNYHISFSKNNDSTKGKTGEHGNAPQKSGSFIHKRKLPGQSYFQVLDRIVILVALTGALIRLGNYFNSEIIGKPTESSLGVVFANPFTEAIQSPRIDPKKFVESVEYRKNDSIPAAALGKVPISIYIFFKSGVSHAQASSMIELDAQDLLSNKLTEFFDVGTSGITYKIGAEKNGNIAARIDTYGIARHPAQLYESISCVILFCFLFWIWSRYKSTLPPGRLFGIFLIVCFGLRFVYEYLKENQVSFENDLPLNMGQILSIPLVMAGILVLLYSYRLGNKQNTDTVKSS
jgi:phosphatidylglycerol:prolipoprotein diacylglycerol transferase